MAEKDSDKPDLAVVIRALGFDPQDIENLHSSGWKGVRCPFHDDSSPSASANIKVGAFKCFKCDMKGDVWSLIMRVKGVEFRDAVAWAEHNVGYASRRVRRPARKSWKPSWAAEVPQESWH